MIRQLILSLVALTLFVPALVRAQVHVKGYTRRDGTYVQPHYRSSPNGTTLDNWSTRGNVNPYTSQDGSRDPYALHPLPPRQPLRPLGR